MMIEIFGNCVITLTSKHMHLNYRKYTNAGPFPSIPGPKNDKKCEKRQRRFSYVCYFWNQHLHGLNAG